MSTTSITSDAQKSPEMEQKRVPLTAAALEALQLEWQTLCRAQATREPPRRFPRRPRGEIVRVVPALSPKTEDARRLARDQQARTIFSATMDWAQYAHINSGAPLEAAITEPKAVSGRYGLIKTAYIVIRVRPGILLPSSPEASSPRELFGVRISEIDFRDIMASKQPLAVAFSAVTSYPRLEVCAAESVRNLQIAPPAAFEPGRRVSFAECKKPTRSTRSRTEMIRSVALTALDLFWAALVLQDAGASANRDH